LLEVKRILLQVRQDIDILPKHVLIQAVILQLSDVIHRSKCIAEVRIFKLLGPRQRGCAYLIGSSAA
jgi:hypothetical protein